MLVSIFLKFEKYSKELTKNEPTIPKKETNAMIMYAIPKTSVSPLDISGAYTNFENKLYILGKRKTRVLSYTCYTYYTCSFGVI